MFVSDKEVEARFVMGLPARGRTILGKEAIAMFLQEIPEIATQSLFFNNLNNRDITLHVETVEDQVFFEGEKRDDLLIDQSGVPAQPVDAVGDGGVFVVHSLYIAATEPIVAGCRPRCGPLCRSDHARRWFSDRHRSDRSPCTARGASGSILASTSEQDAAPAMSHAAAHPSDQPYRFLEVHPVAGSGVTVI